MTDKRQLIIENLSHRVEEPIMKQEQDKRLLVKKLDGKRSDDDNSKTMVTTARSRSP